MDRVLTLCCRVTWSQQCYQSYNGNIRILALYIQAYGDV